MEWDSKLGSHKKGFILRTTTFGDSDLIFDFLDQSGSLTSYRARGAKASKKRFAGGVLEPLQYIELQYENKGGGQPLLLEAKIVKAFENIRSDYDRILWGMNILKLTRYYSQEGLEEPSLFDLVGNALKHLNSSAVTPEIIYWHFLARMMALQGDLDRNGSVGVLLQSSVGEIVLDQRALWDVSKNLKIQFRNLFGKNLSELL